MLANAWVHLLNLAYRMAFAVRKVGCATNFQPQRMILAPVVNDGKVYQTREAWQHRLLHLWYSATLRNGGSIDDSVNRPTDLSAGNPGDAVPLTLASLIILSGSGMQREPVFLTKK